VFTEATDDGSGGDSWSYKSCKVPVELSPPTNPHLTFYRLDALLSPNQECQSTEGMIIIITIRIVFSINEEALRRANKDRQILNSVWQRKHRWIGHVLIHDGLLNEITEGRMKGKRTRGRRRIQMLHDLANDGGFVALKRAAEDREGWRHGERMSKTCCTAEDY